MGRRVVAAVAGAVIGGCAIGGGASPPTSAAGARPAPREPTECPEHRPLERGDLQCRCGLETFETHHWNSLDTYRRYADGVIWLCTERRQLKVTLESELGGRGGAQ